MRKRILKKKNSALKHAERKAWLLMRGKHDRYLQESTEPNLINIFRDLHDKHGWIKAKLRSNAWEW